LTNYARWLRRLTKLQDAEALTLDFVLADDAALKTGVDRAVTLEHGGVSYRLAPPEVIIDLKKRRMSPKDRNDIAGLERLIHGNPDHDEGAA